MINEGEVQMSCEEISLKSFIDEIKEVSSGPHPRKFCFVLGAGASKTSGIKSCQEFVDKNDSKCFQRLLMNFLSSQQVQILWSRMKIILVAI